MDLRDQIQVVACGAALDAVFLDYAKSRVEHPRGEGDRIFYAKQVRRLKKSICADAAKVEHLLVEEAQCAG